MFETSSSLYTVFILLSLELLLLLTLLVALGIRHPDKNGFQLKPMQEAIMNFLKDAKDRKGG